MSATASEVNACAIMAWSPTLAPVVRRRRHWRTSRARV